MRGDGRGIGRRVLPWNAVVRPALVSAFLARLATYRSTVNDARLRAARPGGDRKNVNTVPRSKATGPGVRLIRCVVDQCVT